MFVRERSPFSQSEKRSQTKCHLWLSPHPLASPGLSPTVDERFFVSSIGTIEPIGGMESLNGIPGSSSHSRLTVFADFQDTPKKGKAALKCH
jgi:hypothetical protein